MTATAPSPRRLDHLLQFGARPVHHPVADPVPLRQAYVDADLEAEIIDWSAFCEELWAGELVRDPVKRWRPPSAAGISRRLRFRSAQLLRPLPARSNRNSVCTFRVSPSTSSTGYARKLMGPEAGPGSTSRSRPRVNSNRLAGWWPK